MSFYTITTFINPTLFWVLEETTNKSTETLKTLQESMKKQFDNKNKNLNETFQIGDIVALFHKEQYYRAIIEEISSESNYKILCWLIDFGTMIETSSNNAQKLPPPIRKTAPLACQASLNNVTYVHECFGYNESGKAVSLRKFTKFPSPAAFKCSLNIIANSKVVKFHFETKIDGILCGDILFFENEEKSLRQVLVEKNLIGCDEKMFKNVIEYINEYKEANLGLIADICQNFKLSQKKGDNKVSSETISKYLGEFEERKFEKFPTDCRRSRMNKSKKSKISDLSESDISENSRSFHEKSEKNLRNFLKENMDKSSKDVQSISSSDIENSVSPSGRDKLLSYLKNKKSVSPKPEPQLDDTASSVADSEPRSRSERQSQPVASRVPKKAMFAPAGVSLATLPKKKPLLKTKRAHKKSNVTSSNEDSSIGKPEAKTTDENEKGSTTNDKKLSASDTDQCVAFEKGKSRTNMNVQPFCMCRQCLHWTSSEDWQKRAVFEGDEAEKVVLDSVAPPDFLKRGNEDLDRVVVSLDYSALSKVQKNATPKILLHSDCNPPPVNQVSSVNFHKDVKEKLHCLDYKKPKRVQIYGWPALLRNQHVCLVNGPKTGKTMAYLPVMCSFLTEKKERYNFNLKATSPLFVVLCPNTRKCEDVYDLTRVVMPANRAKVVSATYVHKNMNMSQVDVLITTPILLVTLLKNNHVTLKKLCHLVLEDGDRILLKHSAVLGKILDLVQSMLDNRVHAKSVQLVVCSEHWTAQIERLLGKLSRTPLVCIGNMLEAALYGKASFSLRFVDSARKQNALNSLLGNIYRFCKTVIVCNSEEVPDVETMLWLKGIANMALSEDMKKDQILTLEESWQKCKGGDYKVLICTDHLLNSELTITDADLVVHYSLPNSWTEFVKRFGCFLENVRSPLSAEETKMKCQSVVFCDENSKEEMVKLFNFIERSDLKQQLSGKLKEFSESLKQSHENEKIEAGTSLCDNLKLFGRCSVAHCPFRHALSKKLDDVDSVPSSGKIKFQIVDLLDVTSFSVRLLEHVDAGGEARPINYEDVTEDLTSSLNIVKKKAHNAKLGCVYAYYAMDDEPGEMFHRCEVLEKEDDFVKIRLLDSGVVTKTMKSRLYRLPEEFKDDKKPRRVLKAYLADYVPCHQDDNFPAKAFFQFKAKMEKINYKSMTMTADVGLRLGDTLWLKNVQQEVVVNDRTMRGVLLSSEILKIQAAEVNGVQTTSLSRLCRQAGIEVVFEEEKVAIGRAGARKTIEGQWAHLERGQANKVVFSAAVSPDEIYLRLEKFDKQLKTLQKEIQQSLKKPNYLRLGTVQSGTVCLAKDPEGSDYARALVRRVDEDKALCFFVDYGDEFAIEVSDLRAVEDRFVKKLPFQTVRCGLFGVEPVLGEWQDEVTDVLYSYAFEPSSDVFRSLYVKVCEKTENAGIPKQNCYSVLLKDGFGEKRALINKLFVDSGLALLDGNEIEDFEVTETSTEGEEWEEEEEVEEVRNICKATEVVEENFHLNDEAINELKQMEEMDLVINDPLAFYLELTGRNKPSALPLANSDLPAIKAAPPVDYNSPKVMWSQTEDKIRMSIVVADVKSYEVTVALGRMFNFRTTKNDKLYVFKALLYEKVHDVKHEALGLKVKVSLTKDKPCEWPRLLFAKQKLRNVIFDLESVKDGIDGRRKILELPKGSDEESSDGDEIDVMYNVCSDLDSDLDHDLNFDSD